MNNYGPLTTFFFNVDFYQEQFENTVKENVDDLLSLYSNPTNK